MAYSRKALSSSKATERWDALPHLNNSVPPKHNNNKLLSFYDSSFLNVGLFFKVHAPTDTHTFTPVLLTKLAAPDPLRFNQAMELVKVLSTLPPTLISKTDKAASLLTVVAGLCLVAFSTNGGSYKLVE